MSHAIVLTDEQYEALRNAAARSDETPDQLLGRMVSALAETQGPVYFTDDELLRALGADDEELPDMARLESQPNADDEASPSYLAPTVSPR